MRQTLPSTKDSTVAQNISRSMLVAWFVGALASTANGVEFVVAIDPQLAPSPLSGRLLVFLSTGTAEPRSGPNWFHCEPFFGVDVRQFSAASVQLVDARADGFPTPLDRLAPGHYRAQAVLNVGDSPHAGRGEGNLYGPIVEFDVPQPGQERSSAPLALQLDKVVNRVPPPVPAWAKRLVIASPLLSTFHGRPIEQRALVVLPSSYDQEPTRRYPVVYLISGFGGSEDEGLRHPAPPAAKEGEVELIRVYLNAQCRWGHHVFADSATNGPRGRALVEELIPAVDARFRTVPVATARFVSGHSSGGWASLWLQISYPDLFGGTWSTAPDPVDFHDWQQVDLYAAGENMYRDHQEKRRPIARSGDQPVLWYDDFARMDDVLGVGGQLRSFEAVFSPLDEHGLPRRLWDRQTGAIDASVAEAWRAYDIRLKLEREWPTLGPKLRGKLHVATGSLDTFYLDGAVRRLAGSLAHLGSDAVVEIVAGRNHANLLDDERLSAMRRQMARSFLAHHEPSGTPKTAHIIATPDQGMASPAKNPSPSVTAK